MKRITDIWLLTSNSKDEKTEFEFNDRIESAIESLQEDENCWKECEIKDIKFSSVINSNNELIRSALIIFTYLKEEEE